MLGKAVTHYCIALELLEGNMVRQVARVSQSKRVDGGVL